MFDMYEISSNTNTYAEETSLTVLPAGSSSWNWYE